jgi:hypothetical protein
VAKPQHSEDKDRDGRSTEHPAEASPFEAEPTPNSTAQPKPRGKPPSAKTVAIRRVIQSLGGPADADPERVIAEVRKQSGLDVTGLDVSNQKTALRKQAAGPASTSPPPASADSQPPVAPDRFSAQDMRDFLALVRRLGLANLRVLMEMMATAEAIQRQTHSRQQP